MCVLGTRAVLYDAPVLKIADIGVSLGKSGTDIAKEAAGVILVDGNFCTTLRAFEEGTSCLRSNCADLRDGIAGKSIFHNIQNCLSFQLSNAAAAAAALTLITLSTTLCRSCSSTPSWMVSNFACNFAFSQILVLTRLDGSAELVARGRARGDA